MVEFVQQQLQALMRMPENPLFGVNTLRSCIQYSKMSTAYLMVDHQGDIGQSYPMLIIHPSKDKIFKWMQDRQLDPVQVSSRTMLCKAYTNRFIRTIVTITVCKNDELDNIMLRTLRSFVTMILDIIILQRWPI